MVKKADELKHVMLHNMKGGKGAVEKIASAEPEEYEGGAKVIGRLVLRPGVSIGEHTHEGDEEIMTILAGHACYHEGDAQYILEPGDVTVCKNGESHWVENAPETENLELFVLVNTVNS